MRPFFNGNAAEKLATVRAGLRHAFAVRPEDQPLSIEDVQLLERIAETIVKRGMAAPATMFLESMGPMNFLGSQALHFITPIIECVFAKIEFRVQFQENRCLISLCPVEQSMNEVSHSLT